MEDERGLPGYCVSFYWLPDGQNLVGSRGAPCAMTG